MKYRKINIKDMIALGDMEENGFRPLPNERFKLFHYSESGHNLDYLVSSFGRVIDLKSGKVLSEKEVYLDEHNKHYIPFRKNRIYVDFMVAISFMYKPTSAIDVTHMNGVNSNDNLENLDWVHEDEESPLLEDEVRRKEDGGLFKAFLSPYIDRKLFLEDKEDLVRNLGVIDKDGKFLDWPQLMGLIRESGYSIKKYNRRFGPNAIRRSYSIITPNKN